MDILWQSTQFLVFLFELTIMFKYLKSILMLKDIEYPRIWLVITSMLCYIITLYPTYQMISSFIIFLLMYIYICIFFNGSVFKKIYGFGSFMFINIAIESTVALFFSIVLDIPLSEISDTGGDTLTRLIAIVITKVLLLLCVFIYTKQREKKYSVLLINVNKRLMFGVASLFLVIIFIAILILDISLKLSANVSMYLLMISIFGLSIISIIIYEGILNESEKQMNFKLQLQKKESEHKYNHEMAVTVDSIRGINHDINNHLAVIGGYIQMDNCKKAKDYIDKLSQPMEFMSELLDIQHQAISSILYVKTLLARKKNISITTDIDLSEELFVEDMDMTIILGNLLDNAIEATLHIHGEDKKIKLSIKTIEDYLIIDCVNTMNPQQIKYQEKKFMTTKKDSKNHGIGLNNIKKIVSKYEGHMHIDIVGNKFAVNITLFKNTE